MNEHIPIPNIEDAEKWLCQALKKEGLDEQEMLEVHELCEYYRWIFCLERNERLQELRKEISKPIGYISKALKCLPKVLEIAVIAEQEHDRWNYYNNGQQPWEYVGRRQVKLQRLINEREVRAAIAVIEKFYKNINFILPKSTKRQRSNSTSIRVFFTGLTEELVDYFSSKYPDKSQKDVCHLTAVVLAVYDRRSRYTFESDREEWIIRRRESLAVQMSRRKRRKGTPSLIARLTDLQSKSPDLLDLLH